MDEPRYVVIHNRKNVFRNMKLPCSLHKRLFHTNFVRVTEKELNGFSLKLIFLHRFTYIFLFLHIFSLRRLLKVNE